MLSAGSVKSSDVRKASSSLTARKMKSLSRVQLCDPMDCSLPGSSIHGIFQTRVLERVDISFSRGSPNPGIEPVSPTLAGGFFTTEPPGKPILPSAKGVLGDPDLPVAILQPTGQSELLRNGHMTQGGTIRNFSVFGWIDFGERAANSLLWGHEI